MFPIVKEKLKFFFKLFLLLFISLSIGRFYFFLKYIDAYSKVSLSDLAISFLNGVRFDLSTVSILTGPFILFFFLPRVYRTRYLARAILTALLVWFIILLAYDFVDILYYGFVQRHLTFEIENTINDINILFGIGVKRYFFEFIGFILVLILFILCYVKMARTFLRRSEESDLSRGVNALIFDLTVFVLIIPVLVLSIRGGVQSKPLGVQNAFRNETLELGILSLNGLYTTMNSIVVNRNGNSTLNRLNSLNIDIDQDDMIKMIVSSTRESSERDYPLFRRFHYNAAEKKPMNVVIFIMESWSAKFVGALNGKPDVTPFLDELSRDGLLLTNCFANGQRSIEGLSAILGSVSVGNGMVLGQGGGLLNQTRLKTLGEVFKENGYENLFIHGARRGSMGFDGLIKRVGFERSISREDFEIKPTTDDGIWGIFDEYVFLRADREMRRMRSPFFTVIYSLTSHSPYALPSKEFEYFGASVPFRDFLNVMRYSDHALMKFFKEAEKSPYFKDTLFVIIADHTEGTSTSDNIYEAHRIPCLLYSPGHLTPGRYDKVVSQVDMLSSMIDFLKISTQYTSWGRSIFTPEERMAVLPRGDFFVYVKEPYMILSNIESARALYNFTVDPSRNILDVDGRSRKIADRLNRELQVYLRFSYKTVMENKVRPPNAHLVQP